MSKINSFVLVLIIAVAMSSCTDKSKNLINTWRIENVTFSKPIPPQFMGQLQQQIEMMKSMARITYKADGTTEDVEMGKSHSGSWEMSKDGKVIYVVNEQGGTDRYLIKELSKDKFTYVLPSRNGDTLTFFYVPFSAKDTLNKKPMPQMMQPQAQQPQGQGGEAPADSASK